MAERKEVQIDIKGTDQASPAFASALASGQMLFGWAQKEARAAAREFEAARQQADRVRTVESQTNAQRLQNTGRFLEAELELIRESFRKKYELAATEAEKIALMELQVQREKAARIASFDRLENSLGGRGVPSAPGRTLGALNTGEFQISATTAAMAAGMGGAAAGNLFSGGVGTLLKAAGVTAGVIGTVRTAMLGVQAVSQGIRGEWEKVQATVDKVPFGIGRLNETLREMAFLLDGTSETLDEGRKTIEGMQASQQMYKERISARDQLRALSDQLGLDAKAGNESEFDQQRRVVAFALGETLRRIDAFERAAGDDAEPAVAEKARARARKLALDEELRISHEEAVAVQKVYDEADARTKEAADLRIAEAERVASLDSEIRQRVLASEGKDLEARLEQIQEHYRERIAAAATAAERQRLEELRGLDEAAARRAGAGVGAADSIAPRARAQSIAAETLKLVLDRNMTGIAALAGAGSFSPTERTARNTEKSTELLQKIERHLDRQADPGAKQRVGVLAL